MAAKQSFAKAFAAARKEKGAGKTFTWNGKSYSTNTKEDVAKKAAPRPRANPNRAPSVSSTAPARPARKDAVVKPVKVTASGYTMTNDMPAAKSGASRSVAGKVSAKSGASRSTAGKVSPKSGASRSVAGKASPKPKLAGFSESLLGRALAKVKKAVGGAKTNPKADRRGRTKG
jgi:hypothetical protein